MIAIPNIFQSIESFTTKYDKLVVRPHNWSTLPPIALTNYHRDM